MFFIIIQYDNNSLTLALSLSLALSRSLSLSHTHTHTHILGASNDSARDISSDMEYLMKELDSDGDGNITYEEMRKGLTNWLKEQKAEQDAKKKAAVSAG